MIVNALQMKEALLVLRTTMQYIEMNQDHTAGGNDELGLLTPLKK